MKDHLHLQVQQCLQPLLGLSHFSGQKLHLLLGLSGGLDSTVLLHALAGLRDELGFTFSAMHVHHGLSPHADAWEAFCYTLCQQQEIPLQVARVHVDKLSGSGIEATARRARYDALHAADADYVVLAHHQNDQAETMLLQLARGAGVKGLAAMPAVDHQRKRLRPLLNISRKALEKYANENSLSWVEDESNTDTDYDRNFIRHEILPRLAKRYPSIAETLSRTASHMVEANTMLDELAHQDAQANNLFDCQATPSTLNVDGLIGLSQARAANVLRWWLAQHHQAMPNTQRLHEMLRQLCYAKSDAQVQIRLNHEMSVRRYQAQAYVVSEHKTAPDTHFVWHGEPEHVLPDGARLLFKEVVGAGCAKQHLLGKIIEVRYRSGNEKIKLHAQQPTRTLKYLFQQVHIPPWQRKQYPLLYIDGVLAVVPSVGVALLSQAHQGVAGIQVIYASHL